MPSPNHPFITYAAKLGFEKILARRVLEAAGEDADTDFLLHSIVLRQQIAEELGKTSLRLMKIENRPAYMESSDCFLDNTSHPGNQAVLATLKHSTGGEPYFERRRVHFKFGKKSLTYVSNYTAEHFDSDHDDRDSNHAEEWAPSKTISNESNDNPVCTDTSIPSPPLGIQFSEICTYVNHLFDDSKGSLITQKDLGLRTSMSRENLEGLLHAIDNFDPCNNNSLSLDLLLNLSFCSGKTRSSATSPASIAASPASIAPSPDSL